MTIVKITDHVARGISRVLSQFKDSKSVLGIIAALASEVQQVEDGLFGMLALRSIDSATGVHLDRIGKIVGELRDGRDDAAYRIGIRARVLLNKSSGTTPEILALFRMLVTNKLRLEEFDPAALVLHIETEAVSNPDALYKVLQAIAADGVRALLHYLTTTEANTFTLPLAAFTTGSTSIGATTIPVDDTTSFPDQGGLWLGYGLASQEQINYSSKTPTSFVCRAGYAATQAHVANEAATLLYVTTAAGTSINVPGLGLGDSSNPSTGGALSSIL